MAMQQEPIDWRYLPYKAYFLGLCKGNIPSKDGQKYGTFTYLHQLDPGFPID